MSLRQLPGALILGLLAFLAAHSAGFGGDHLEAGAYHELLSTVALAGAGGGLVAAIWAAFGNCGSCMQGSVMAARLAMWIPRSRFVAVTGSAWFVLVESVEPAHHSASILVVGLAMVLAALVVRWLALAASRLLAACVITVACAPAAQRTVFIIRRYTAPAVVTPHLSRRIVTRPPPRVALLLT